MLTRKSGFANHARYVKPNSRQTNPIRKLESPWLNINVLKPRDERNNTEARTIPTIRSIEVLRLFWPRPRSLTRKKLNHCFCRRGSDYCQKLRSKAGLVLPVAIRRMSAHTESIRLSDRPRRLVLRANRSAG